MNVFKAEFPWKSLSKSDGKRYIFFKSKFEGKCHWNIAVINLVENYTNSHFTYFQKEKVVLFTYTVFCEIASYFRRTEHIYNIPAVMIDALLTGIDIHRAIHHTVDHKWLIVWKEYFIGSRLETILSTLIGQCMFLHFRWRERQHCSVAQRKDTCYSDEIDISWLHAEKRRHDIPYERKRFFKVCFNWVWSKVTIYCQLTPSYWQENIDRPDPAELHRGYVIFRQFHTHFDLCST